MLTEYYKYARQINCQLSQSRFDWSHFQSS